MKGPKDEIDENIVYKDKPKKPIIDGTKVAL